MTDNVRRMYEQNASKFKKRCEVEEHYGIRSGYYEDEGTSSGDAVRAMRRQLRAAGDVSSGDRVLDIGCGFGDCLLWLAETHGVSGVGVDFARTQIEVARDLADERNLADAVTFREGDFHDLDSVVDGSFDVVWAVEALMHTARDEAAVDACARALADDGRMVVGDFFQTPSELERTSLLHDFHDGNEASLARIDAFADLLRATGFTDVKWVDITASVSPGVRKRAKYAKWLFRPVIRVLTALGLVETAALDSMTAAIAGGELLASDEVGYYVVTARRDTT